MRRFPSLIRMFLAFAAAGSSVACAAPLPAGSIPAGDTRSPLADEPADPAPASARAQANRISRRYGIADFPAVRSIRFTVRFREGDETRVRRWTWRPRSDSVVYRGEDAKGLSLAAAYSRRNRFSLASETIARIDGEFERDRFWLLFPLQLAWDKGLDIRVGKGGRLTVRFPAEPGSPAQAIYEIEAEPDGAIKALTLHRAETAAQRVEWSPPIAIGGLPLSLERKGPGGFEIRFTEVAVEGLEKDPGAPGGG